MATLSVKTRRWSRIEYAKLIETGFFPPGERLELLGGDLVVREPQGDPHVLAIERANEALRAAFGPGWRVRVQLPIALDDESEPEPDLSVAPSPLLDTSEAKPSHPALLIEVAESSLAFDREHKGSLYARAQVPDYWIVNLVDRVLEVHREPGAHPAAPYGWCYSAVQVLQAGAFISPLAAAQARISIADLLP